MEGQRGEDHVHVQADHLREDTYVNHVANEVAEIRWNIWVVAHDSLDRHGIDGNIRAGDGLLDIVSVEKCSARCNRCQVTRERVWVYSNDDVASFVVGDESVLVGADDVPGRQTLNVRGKKILARNGNAHLEDGAQDGVVGGGTA